MFSARCGFTQQAGPVGPPTMDIAFVYANSPYILSFSWTDASGYGSKYSNPTAASSFGRGITFKTDNTTVFATTSSTPWIAAWAYTLGTGFGSKYSNPASLGNATPEEVAWNDTTSSVVNASSASPYIHGWAWSSGFGTKYSNPATSVGGSADGVQFNRAGNVIITGRANSPWVSAYPWSSSGFGTKFTQPGTIPTAETSGYVFGATDNYVAMTTYGYTVTSYQWNNTTGFGTRLSNVSASGDGSQLDGLVLASGASKIITASSDSSIELESFNIDSSGNVTSGSSTTGGFAVANNVTINKTGAAIVTGGDQTPWQNAYAWNGSGFGSRYSDTASITNSTRRAAFTN